MKLNLRTKLIGSFVIVLLLIGIIGLVSIYTSRHIQCHLENIVEQDVKTANILGVVARRAAFIHSNSLLHVFTESIDDMNRYESEIADWERKIRTQLDTLASILKDHAICDKLVEFRAAWDTYRKIWHEQLVPLSRANRDEEAFTLARKRGAAGLAARETMFKLDELHDANLVAAEYTLELTEQDSRKSQKILMAVVFLATVLGLVFAIRQSSLIAGAVNTVSKTAQLVAAGDFNQNVKVRTGDEIESMADSFNTMTSNMKKMVEELEAFSYSVSHDLRAPLRAIDGFSRLLVEDYSGILDEQAKHYLQRIRIGAQNMSQLIDDLLDLSRIGRRPMNRKTTNLGIIARKAYKSLEHEWQDRKVNFIIHECPIALTDPHFMQIVFANLFSNALKFTQNRAMAQIEVGSETKDKQVIFFVKDNGIGFDMKYAKKLFTPFQRLHSAKEYEGTGIGLATVQRIIHRHGGQIWVESKPGSGTTFYFTI
jgi:signal transduction histidine kinase